MAPGGSCVLTLFLGVFVVIPCVVGETFDNVALRKNYSVISNYSSFYPPSFAADYSPRTCFWSGSETYQYKWWEVNLGRTYPVSVISIVTTSSSYLYPFTITVDGQLCVNESETSVQYGSPRTLTCSSVLYGRAVRITKTAANTGLRLYEVEIKVPSGVSGCRPGRYGSRCLLFCSSYCNDGTGNTLCYQSTGHCYDDCQSGLYGPYCDQSCRSPRCVDNKCHRDTGLCIDYELKCATVNCSECVAGRWGNQCQYRCDKNCATGTCDHKTGNCSACLPGWYGDKCDQECRSKNCLLRMCHQETGRCEACNGNYAGDSCSECRDGFFRKTPDAARDSDAAQCTECPWRCDNNTHCNKTSGTCDMCPVGWEGSRCLQRVDQQAKDEKGDNDGETEKLVAPVVGAIVGIGLLLTVSVVAAICLRNRSQKTDTNADTLNASSSGSDSVAAVTNVYTISPTTASSSATEPMEDPPRENRDQRNPYESLGGYRNMTFQTEALFPIEMATASHHSDVSEEQTYVNSQGLNTKNA